MHIAVLVFVLLTFVGAGIFAQQGYKAIAVKSSEEAGWVEVGAAISALIFFVGAVGLFVIWSIWLLH